MKRFSFRYLFQKPPDRPLVELTLADAEKFFLEQLDKQELDPSQKFWKLTSFYIQSHAYGKALALLDGRADQETDIDRKSDCYLSTALCMEGLQRWDEAIEYYRKAHALGRCQSPQWYFINNNLGFCLNTLGKHEEGERYCRAAIEVNHDLPNAYKNLGVALQGQNRPREAAQAYITALRVNVADTRPLALFKKLMADHPELEEEFKEDLEACRRVVEAVETLRAQHPPKVRRGAAAKWHLFQLRLRQSFQTALRRVGGRFRR
jgi:tetratricopeptide (TPR) repeat protein